MYRFSIDRAKDRPDPRVLLHRSYYAHDVPRLMALCRLLGHKPVVDGYDSKYGPEEHRRSRWVACDRCGVRPDPQGSLSPDEWNLGQPYTGPMTGTWTPGTSSRNIDAYRPTTPGRAPGPWPDKPTGVLGAELIIGRSHSIGADIKVGNAGSEHVLAAHIGLGPLGALYVHTEHFGQWVQRRFNPTGYESRETGFSIYEGDLSWKLWAKRDSWSKTDPKWMRGSFSIDPRHHLLGPRKNRKVSETEKVPAVVRMPEGDTHDVLVHLEQWETRRTRGRARTYWTAEWACEAGIPVRNHDWKGNETYSCAWGIEGVTPDNPRWPYILAAKAAEQCTRDRARYDYRAPETA
ncbi:hypothetical protein ACFZAR_36400 [Streptomyces sp. NPDC008222]|uniref:hypothetical protein n=1 Tax=Streptomyces sp. NPDC008222 TaxID=3364820 RepID=UPI0036E15230